MQDTCENVKPLACAAVRTTLQRTPFHFTIRPTFLYQPDAKQVPVTGQETAFIPESDRAGMLTIRHLLPFQVSANWCVFAPSVETPTATHEVAVGHDTALKKLAFCRATLGVYCSRHLPLAQIS